MSTTRSERARREVLAVAADLVMAVGVERLTIDEVANRSGVAKTTIYRHWPNKGALVTEAVHGCMAPTPPPPEGDLRGGLLACFEGAVRSGGPESRVGEMMLSLLDAAQRDPELDRLLRGYVAERRRPVLEVLEAARARGELAPDADLELLATMMAGPVVYTKLLLRQPVTRELVENVVDGVLKAARQNSTPPVPEERPGLAS
jgi:AcrR family transcriptional regulator